MSRKAAVATSVAEIQDAPVASLTTWEKNPRRITKERFDALVRSMRDDPEMLRARPLIAMSDGRVIAGNMRLRAAVELGWETVPTVYVELDEERATTWALRDNNPYGEWDDEALAEMLYEIEQTARLDLELTGFTKEDLDALLASVAPDPVDRGNDLTLADVSVGDPTHVCSRGEVWNVGPHLLVVEPVYDGWPQWVELLTEGDLLVPYPTPTLPLTVRANQNRLIMVQPDVWLAGHVLDKYSAVKGDDQVSRYR